VTLDVPTAARLPEHAEITTYFAVSEALTNAAKHSHASAVNVIAESVDGDVRLSIDDDGVGGADPARSSGLVGCATASRRWGEGSRSRVHPATAPI